MRRPKDIARHGPNGIERCCLKCGAWLPQDARHFYRRGKGNWFVNCIPCQLDLDHERAAATRRTRGPSYDLAVALGEIPR